MSNKALTDVLTPTKHRGAIVRITRLSQETRERLERNQFELERHYPEGAERLSVALSDLDDLEEYAERIIRMRTSPRH
jgi:hypothetical protein